MQKNKKTIQKHKTNTNTKQQKQLLQGLDTSDVSEIQKHSFEDFLEKQNEIALEAAEELGVNSAQFEKVRNRRNSERSMSKIDSAKYFEEDKKLQEKVQLLMSQC